MTVLRRMRIGDCLGLDWYGLSILILIFWLFCTNPSFAGVWSPQIGAETETCFATQSVLVDVCDPSDAMAIDARSLPSRSGLHRNIGFYFCAEFLAARNSTDRPNYGALHIKSEVCPVKNLSSDLDIKCSGFASIKANKISSDPVVVVNLTLFNLWRSAFQFRGMNLDLWSMGGIKFLAREFDAFACGNPKSKSEGRYRNSSESREESIVLINEPQTAIGINDDDGDGIALFVGVFGGLLAALLTYAGLKRVCELVFGPNKHA
jgi:hypothetical protein